MPSSVAESSLRLVVFDCDGTLVDSQHGIVSCMREAFTAHGCAVPEDAAIRRSVGLSLEDAVSRLLADSAVLKVAHNAKYDLGVLRKYGLELSPVDDTMLISYALDGGSHGHGMDELAQRVLGYETIPFESVCGKGAGRILFDQVPVDKATDYAAEDAEVTLRLWQALRPRLLEERMLTVYETLERPLVPVIAAMEGCGIRVDEARLRQLSAEFGQRMAQLEEEAYRLAGHRFNIGSPKQLGEVLFDRMGLGASGPGPAGMTPRAGAYASFCQFVSAQTVAIPRSAEQIVQERSHLGEAGHK